MQVSRGCVEQGGRLVNAIQRFLELELWLLVCRSITRALSSAALSVPICAGGCLPSARQKVTSRVQLSHPPRRPRGGKFSAKHGSRAEQSGGGRGVKHGAWAWHDSCFI